MLILFYPFCRTINHLKYQKDLLLIVSYILFYLFLFSFILFLFIYKLIILLGLINRVRRIAVLTKYTGEIHKLLIEGIRRSKADGNLPEKYNKTKIPNGNFILLLFILLFIYLFTY